MVARFTRGWLAGVVLFGITLSWTTQFSVVGALLLVAFQACFIAIAAAVTPKCSLRALVFPAALVVAEALRWRLPFGGLPLGGFTTGQADGVLAPALPVTGELGLVACLGLIAVAATLFITERQRRVPIVFVGLVVLLSLGGAAVEIQPSGKLSVAVVQGGGVQALSRNDQDPEAVFQRQLAVTNNVTTAFDLILWPENVVNVNGPIAGSVTDRVMSDLSIRHDTVIAAGVVESEEKRFHNSVMVWDRGVITSRYEKLRRVPFGEYVPARSLIDSIVDLSRVPSDAYPGTGAPVIDFDRRGSSGTDRTQAGVALSYEGLFSRHVLMAAREGGQVILVPTNASSYKSSRVAKNQVESARIHAREAGRWVIQAAPTGKSAIIDNKGRVKKQSGIGPPALLQADVQLSSTRTPVVGYGETPVIALSLLALLVGGLASMWEGRRARQERVPARPHDEQKESC